MFGYIRRRVKVYILSLLFKNNISCCLSRSYNLQDHKLLDLKRTELYLLSLGRFRFNYGYYDDSNYDIFVS